MEPPSRRSKRVHHIHHLHVDALYRVFNYLPTIERVRVMPAVCRRWREALARPTAAWADLNLEQPSEFSLDAAIRQHGQARVESFIAWLAPRAGGVVSLNIETQLFSPATQRAALLCVSERLTGLRVGALRGRYLADATVLTRLTRLEVANLQSFEDTDVGVLGCLPDLQALSLASARPVAPEAPPALLHSLSALTGLRRLCLVDVVDVLPPCVSCLAALTELTLQWRYGQATLPEELGECAELQRLEVNHTHQCAAAEVVLPASITSLPRLTHLWAGACHFDRHMCQLPVLHAGLTALALVQPHIQDATMRNLLAYSGLRVLVLKQCGLRFFPGRLDTICGLSSLTALNLADNMLTSLPGGPYLKHLQHLDLSENSFDKVPECLRGAPRLHKLDLSWNRWLYLGRDCCDVLCSLPALRALGVNPLLQQNTEVDSHRLAALLMLQRRLGSGVFVQGDLIKRENEPTEGEFLFTCDCFVCGLTVHYLWEDHGFW